MQGGTTVTDANGRELFTFRLPTVTGNGWSLKLNVHKDAPRRKQHGRIACLTPTYEVKRGWMDLLLAQWSRQSHKDRLLIIADGAPDAITLEPGDDERILYHHLPGTSLATRRNYLLQQARTAGADWFCWFDDDELRDPRWLELLLAAWDGDAQVVTPAGHIFLDVETGATREYRAADISLSGAIFETERCARYRFPDVFPEDTPWLQAVAMSRRVQRVDDFFVWNVAHADNIGNPRVKIFGGVMTDDYEIGQWRDRPLYISRRDAYSTLDLDRFRAHMRRFGVEVNLDPETPTAAEDSTAVEDNAAVDPDTDQQSPEAYNPEDDAYTADGRAALEEADAILFADAVDDDEPETDADPEPDDNQLTDEV